MATTSGCGPSWLGWLDSHGFRFRNEGRLDPEEKFQEWDFVQGPLLQRLVIYVKPHAGGGSEEFLRAVLRTKCSPGPHVLAMYDVEAYSVGPSAKGPQALEPWLVSQREQLSVSGQESFFRNPEWAEPHGDPRTPVAV